MNEAQFYLEDLKSKFLKIDFTKYYLSYSGGRDSHFLYWFIKEYLKDKKIKIVSINTFLEHNQIKNRMLKHSDIILKPNIKPMEIKQKYGIPCFSKMQDEFISRYQNGQKSKSTMQFINGTKNNGKTMFKLSNNAKNRLLNNNLHKISNKCCYYLKKQPFKQYEKESGLKPILGIRTEESLLRKAQYQSCFTKDLKFTPIYDLTDELLKQIENEYQIEVPDIYKKISRTGCMGCPYGSYFGDTIKELRIINQNQRNFILDYFKESYQVLGINYHKQLSIFDFLGE